jgi:tetratricopeptide (TPR) repeat protein
MGETYLERGDHQLALDCYETAVRVFGQFDDRNREAINLRNMGRVHLEAGRLDEAQRYLEKALMVFEEFNNRHQCAIARHGLTYVELRRNFTKGAVAQLEEFGAIFREFNDRRWEIRNSVALAEVFLSLGRLDQSATELAKSSRLAVEMGSSLWRARVLRVRAALLTREGRDLDAANTYEEAKEILASLKGVDSNNRANDDQA